MGLDSALGDTRRGRRGGLFGLRRGMSECILLLFFRSLEDYMMGRRK